MSYFSLRKFALIGIIKIPLIYISGGGESVCVCGILFEVLVISF